MIFFYLQFYPIFCCIFDAHWETIFHALLQLLLIKSCGKAFFRGGKWGYSTKVCKKSCAHCVKWSNLVQKFSFDKKFINQFLFNLKEEFEFYCRNSFQIFEFSRQNSNVIILNLKKYLNFHAKNLDFDRKIQRKTIFTLKFKYLKRILPLKFKFFRQIEQKIQTLYFESFSTIFHFWTQNWSLAHCDCYSTLYSEPSLSLSAFLITWIMWQPPTMKLASNFLP